MERGLGRPRSTPSSALLVLALYAAIAFLLLLPTFRPFGNVGGKDWNAFLGQAQAEMTSLLDHGEFPAWNPWRRGGQVSFAQPESMFLSPVTPLALFVGANAAFKLLLLPLFVAAAMGMWALAGDLGLAGVARALPGAIFVGASVFPLYVAGGLPNWLAGMAILPWLLLASRRAATSGRWLVGGAALLAALLCCGDVHHFVFFPLLLGLEAAARALVTRGWRPLLATAALGVTGVALSLVRLVPLLELFSEFPRRIDATGRFMPLALVGRSLFVPHPPGIDETRRVFVAEGSALTWVDCGAYVGPAVGVLVVAGALLAWRRAWPHLLIGAFFLWLALGSGVRVSLWDALHHLPVYESMQAPERFMGFVVFALALLAGFGGERVLGWLGRWPRAVRGVAAGLLLVAVLVPLLYVNGPLTAKAFPIEPPKDVAPSTLLSRSGPRPPFEQSKFPVARWLWGGPLYEPVLRNVGNTDGQSDVPSKLAARPKGSPSYRGETFLADGHGTVQAEFTPNRVHVRAHLDAGDLVVVNQTFFPGWRSRGAITRACVEHEGLIALPLPAGDHDLVLEFAPATIPIGFALTFLALLVVGASAWRRRRRVAMTPAAGSSPRPRSPVPPVPIVPIGPIGPIDPIALCLHGLLVAGVVGWHATREPSGIGAPPRPWQERSRVVLPGMGPEALQRVVDTGTSGDVFRLRDGDYGPVVIRRGITLVAVPPAAPHVASITITDLPPNERVALLGLQIGGTIRIERCQGLVLLAAPDSPRRRANGKDEPSSPTSLTLSVESSPQLFVFGGPRFPPIARATITNSRVAFARARFAAPNSAPGAAEPTLVADGSVVLLNACAFDSPGAAPGDPATAELALRNRSSARIAETKLSHPAVDATSTLTDLDARPLALSVVGTLTDPDGPSVRITGPALGTGTLIVTRHPTFVPLKGVNAGQFQLADPGTQIQYPFDLDAEGHLLFKLPSFGTDYLPGDGLYFQVYLQNGEDPRARLYSLLDGGPVIPSSN